jgi:ABC-type dipeptide/oligopeptide/nickel transport system ATPase subunit
MGESELNYTGPFFYDAPVRGSEIYKRIFPIGPGLVKAVDDVSFYIDEGELLALVGESGAVNRSQLCRSCGLSRSRARSLVVRSRSKTKN